jgi:YebC/PmpR family DNA-binding regulatory protein
MSGHSRWSTIRRKKAAADAKRGKVFTQLIREITVAARVGGGDPAANPRLRLAMEHARGQNVPRENIVRAIKKGTGELEGEQYEEVSYEGYGPGGAAVLVETITDNRKRTVSDIRHLFGKHGGSLGSSGCVSYLFETKGVLVFDAGALDAERLMEAAIEADALDVREEEDSIVVHTPPDRLESVREALQKGGFPPRSAAIMREPQTTVRLAGREAQSMLRLYSALDEHDDVKQVYSNFDISEREMAEAAQAG